jgi:hypothetical protein
MMLLRSVHRRFGGRQFGVRQFGFCALHALRAPRALRGAPGPTSQQPEG